MFYPDSYYNRYSSQNAKNVSFHSAFYVLKRKKTKYHFIPEKKMLFVRRNNGPQQNVESHLSLSRKNFNLLFDTRFFPPLFTFLCVELHQAEYGLHLFI